MIERADFVLDDEERRLPKDWLPLHIVTSDRDAGTYGVFIKREGRLIPLGEALQLRDLLTSSSQTASRTALDGRKGDA